MRRLLGFATSALAAAVGVLLVLMVISLSQGGVDHSDIDVRLERVEAKVDFVACVALIERSERSLDVITACQFPEE